MRRWCGAIFVSNVFPLSLSLSLSLSFFLSRFMQSPRLLANRRGVKIIGRVRQRDQAVAVALKKTDCFFAEPPNSMWVLANAFIVPWLFGSPANLLPCFVRHMIEPSRFFWGLVS